MIFHQSRHGSGEVVAIHQVRNANAAPPGLVFIAGADTLQRCADGDPARDLAVCPFGNFLHQPVRREKNLRPVADAQLTGHIDAGGNQLFHFFEESQRIDHKAIADHRNLTGVENAARHQTQHEFPVADQDGMAGVVTALVADDKVEPVGKQVHQLALSFVAPLSAENDNIAHLLRDLPGGSSILPTGP